MSPIVLVTGGARSGKSRFAEQLALDHGQPLCYLATAQAFDAEMAERIGRHQQRRGDGWRLVEEPLHLSQALAASDGAYGAILVDCLTLWLTNLLLLHVERGQEAEALVMEEVHRLVTTLRGMTSPVIIVTNEVGMGIVPEHRLGRLFRDLAGQANQAVAGLARQVWLVASGIPLKLK